MTLFDIGHAVATSHPLADEHIEAHIYAWDKPEGVTLTFDTSLQSNPDLARKLITALITPDLARKLITVLQESIDRVEGQVLRDDVALANALVPGTLVRIAQVPMYTRTESAKDAGEGAGDEYASKVGVVTAHVRRPGNDTLGVNAGRVVVSTDIDGWSGGYLYYPAVDIHVSSLTPVEGEPVGFHDVYTPHSDYLDGDTVLVNDPAYVTSGREGATGYVSPRFYGKAGTVAFNFSTYGGESVEVRVNNMTQSIDVSSLRNISAEFRAAEAALAGGTL